MIKLYLRIYFSRFFNFIMRLLGYTRIYDLESGQELTMFYHGIRILSLLKLPLFFDITYPCLGICTYSDDRYMRYVCYDTKLLSAVKEKNILSSKHYHSIKKIELINVRDDPELIDVTIAKDQLYDVSFTRPYDVIRFYQIIHNVFKTYDSFDKYVTNNINSIRIHREQFDDDMLEFVTTIEEVYIRSV